MVSARRLGDRPHQRVRDFLDRLLAVDGREASVLRVVVDDLVHRWQLLLETGRDPLGPVVITLDEHRPVDVALAGNLRRARHDVVDLVRTYRADPEPR